MFYNGVLMKLKFLLHWNGCKYMFLTLENKFFKIYKML